MDKLTLITQMLADESPVVRALVRTPGGKTVMSRCVNHLPEAAGFYTDKWMIDVVHFGGCFRCSKTILTR